MIKKLELDFYQMNFEFVFHRTILRTVLEAVVLDNCHVALHNRHNKARIFSSEPPTNMHPL